VVMNSTPSLFLHGSVDISSHEFQEPAEAAGLQAGDLIQTINDSAVDKWEDALTALFINPNAEAKLEINRLGKPHTIHFIPGEEMQKYRFGGIAIPSKVIVDTVRADFPAKDIGLKPGDQIVAVDGSPIKTIEELQAAVNNFSGTPLEIEINRDDTIISKELIPKFDDVENRYLIGITFAAEQILRKYGPFEAVKMGFVTNYEIGKSMFELLGQLVTGKASIKSLGGPVMIGVLAGQAAKKGIRDLLSLTSFISLNLAILNVLPIPILDGGLILFLFYEAIRRRPPSEKFQIVVQNVFLFALIAFALIVTYNDIIRFVRF